MQKELRQPKSNYEMIVIGAGAAGLMAAIQAARGNVRVLVLEHMDKPGKKLLLTGNGKCNYTNEALFKWEGQQDETVISHYYHGACPAFVLPAIKQFGITETLQFFEELGVYGIVRRGGYYPAGGQASSIRDVLLMECERLGVDIRCEIGIRAVRKAEKNFVIETKNGDYFAKKCVIATGGKSYKKTGSDGSGFLYLERLGHRIQDLVPALVPLQSELAFFKKVAGIRAEISTQIYIDDELKSCESGELQLTDYGISGICIFQMSYLASNALYKASKEKGAKEHVRVLIDFFPSMEQEELQRYLLKRFQSVFSENKSCAQALCGMFPDKLAVALLEEAGFAPAQPASLMSESQIRTFTETVKRFCVPIHATRSFEQAQVTAGGVATDEICADTMESKLIPGLYVAGEMLDIDGICGGFNLQWAWSSGAVAGRHARDAIRSKK